MKALGYAKRRDLNEREIVDALVRRGCSVIRLDQPVDLLVGLRGATWLLEVKRGELAQSDRPLTDAEQRFFLTWRGCQAKVVRCLEEALCVVGIKPCRQSRSNQETGFCGCGRIEDPAWLTQARADTLAAKRAAKPKRRAP